MQRLDECRWERIDFLKNQLGEDVICMILIYIILFGNEKYYDARRSKDIYDKVSLMQKHKTKYTINLLSKEISLIIYLYELSL